MRVCRFKFKLDRSTLEKLYVAFIRSKLHYGNIIWDNCPKHLSDLVESVQYRAGKVVSGAIHRTSHDLLYRELGWDRLEERRKKQRLKVLYKVIHGDAPVYLQQVLNAQYGENNQYTLRNQHDIPHFRVRTSKFLESFFPKTIREWNSLSNDIKLSPSLKTFASKLNADMHNSPKWYYFGNRELSIKHAKMRMLCSNLNDHLFSHIHVIDNPACPCGYIRENNKHFLLECNLYNNERTDMLAALQNIGFEPNLNNLRYGN